MYQPNRTQKSTLIEMILAETPYLPVSIKYKAMTQDLAKLQWDTLLIIRQSQRKDSGLRSIDIENQVENQELSKRIQATPNGRKHDED